MSFLSLQKKYKFSVKRKNFKGMCWYNKKEGKKDEDTLLASL